MTETCVECRKLKVNVEFHMGDLKNAIFKHQRRSSAKTLENVRNMKALVVEARTSLKTHLREEHGELS